MTFISLLYLYIAFRIKHFSCDFLLQTDWMALNKGQKGKDEYKALFSHTSIHALGTFLIVLLFAPVLWWLAILDFIIHSIIDRLKGRVVISKNLQTNNKLFWWAFGVDQELHNFTHLAYICFIFSYLNGFIL